MNRERIFEEYINANLDSIYRFALSCTNNQQDAEDVVSESVIRALKSLASLRDYNALKTWFYSIIYNTAKTMLTQKNELVYVENSTLEIINYDNEGYDDDYSALNFQDIVQVLAPDLRVIIVLRFFEDLTLKQIAEVLKVNENTVKKRFYTAIKILHQKMEE